MEVMAAGWTAPVPTALDDERTAYGRALKEKYFLLDGEYCNLNHGSYGTVPRPVLARQQLYYLEQEARPDAWFRRKYFKYIEDARAVMADLVGTAVENLVLVENASSAMTSVLRSVGLERGDKVLRLSTAYGQVRELMDWLAHTIGIKIVVVQVQFPVTGPEQVLQGVREALQKAEAEGEGIKLCVFSHITSMPAVVLPVQELTLLVHATGGVAPPLVLIDGAHSPGQVQVNIDQIGAEFYLGNCHKWLYAPKGAAFLAVAPSQQLSHSPGTRDYTPLVALPAALQFRELLGGDAQIMRYCHSLAVQGGSFLAHVWGTRLMAPAEMTGFMVTIELPSSDADAVAYMQSTLESRYNIYLVYDKVIIPSEDFAAAGDCGDVDAGSSACASRLLFITRLSAQVYLEFSDFERLGELVPLLLAAYKVS